MTPLPPVKCKFCAFSFTHYDPATDVRILRSHVRTHHYEEYRQQQTFLGRYDQTMKRRIDEILA